MGYVCLLGYSHSTVCLLNLMNFFDKCAAVCQSTNPTVHTQWGRQTCSNGYTLEYAGLVMSTKYDQHPMRDICVDREKAVHTRSHGGDQNGALLYPTEMEQGAADEVLYPPNREVGCAVCSKNEHATGCDGVEGSSILFDVCSICGGNGLPCTPSAAPAPPAVPAMCTRAPAAAVCAGISQWTVPTDPVYLGRPSDEGWSRLVREDRQKRYNAFDSSRPCTATGFFPGVNVGGAGGASRYRCDYGFCPPGYVRSSPVNCPDCLFPTASNQAVWPDACPCVLAEHATFLPAAAVPACSPADPCTCLNGIAATGEDCAPALNGAASCSSCADGYTLSSDSTVCNADPCTCSNGIAATGEDCTLAGAASCSSCDDGYKLSSDSTACNAPKIADSRFCQSALIPFSDRAFVDSACVGPVNSVCNYTVRKTISL